MKKSITVFKGLGFLVFGGVFSFTFLDFFFFWWTNTLLKHCKTSIILVQTPQGHFNAAVHLFEFYLLWSHFSVLSVLCLSLWSLDPALSQPGLPNRSDIFSCISFSAPTTITTHPPTPPKKRKIKGSSQSFFLLHLSQFRKIMILVWKTTVEDHVCLCSFWITRSAVSPRRGAAGRGLRWGETRSPYLTFSCSSLESRFKVYF